MVSGRFVGHTHDNDHAGPGFVLSHGHAPRHVRRQASVVQFAFDFGGRGPRDIGVPQINVFDKIRRPQKDAVQRRGAGDGPQVVVALLLQLHDVAAVAPTGRRQDHAVVLLFFPRVQIGRVQDVQDGKTSLRLALPLHVGGVFRFQTSHPFHASVVHGLQRLVVVHLLLPRQCLWWRG